jgi:two-component system sensor histidine kinase YesM
MRFKITFSVWLYILLIGIAGTVFLYFFLTSALTRKYVQLDAAYLESVRIQVDRNLENMFALAALCSADQAVVRVASRRARNGASYHRDALNAQERLHAFLYANPISASIDKLILFDDRGLFIQPTTRMAGASGDLERIRELPLFKRFLHENAPHISGPVRSIGTRLPRDSWALIARVQTVKRRRGSVYLYMEAGLDLISGVFHDAAADSHEWGEGVFARVEDTGGVILAGRDTFQHPARGTLGYEAAVSAHPHYFHAGGKKYHLDRLPLSHSQIVLYNQVDMSGFRLNDQYVIGTVLAVTLMSLLTAAALGLSLSSFLTKPINALIHRIRRITCENDFSPDPAAETRSDEIGQIGRAVNEMAGSISRFLAQREEHFEAQKAAEIALLETQINPHFLYNTLDSIQWMAKIQNNPAIADLCRRLVNLLRGIASLSKPVGQNGPITLKEELAILDDYVALMQLRFMGAFEVLNRVPEALLGCLVPRLMLQPLVENAILHGIQPTDRFGTITITAREEAEGGERFLFVSVEDNGAGMSAAQLEAIKNRVRRGMAPRRRGQSSPSLNNIGIANVDKRLRLLYGESCGLSFESEAGAFTRATVKIRAERSTN